MKKLFISYFATFSRWSRYWSFDSGKILSFFLQDWFTILVHIFVITNRIDLFINWVVNSFEDLGSLFSLGGCWCRGVLELAPPWLLSRWVGRRSGWACLRRLRVLRSSKLHQSRASLERQPACLKVWCTRGFGSLCQFEQMIFRVSGMKVLFQNTGRWSASSTSIEEVHPRL